MEIELLSDAGTKKGNRVWYWVRYRDRTALNTRRAAVERWLKQAIAESYREPPYSNERLRLTRAERAEYEAHPVQVATFPKAVTADKVTEYVGQQLEAMESPPEEAEPLTVQEFNRQALDLITNSEVFHGVA